MTNTPSSVTVFWGHPVSNMCVFKTFWHVGLSNSSFACLSNNISLRKVNLKFYLVFGLFLWQSCKHNYCIKKKILSFFVFRAKLTEIIKSLGLSFLTPLFYNSFFVLFSFPESKVKEPNFTLKRTFRVENTGLLPITIRSAEINGQTCEGYGFKVLNCQEFALEPNSSKDLVIL